MGSRMGINKLFKAFFWLSPKSRLKTFFILQKNVYLCTHET